MYRPIPPQLHNQKKSKSTTISTLGKIATKTFGTAGIILGSQAVYVGLTTPRLPPPPKSGKEFEEDGLVIPLDEQVLRVEVEDQSSSTTSNINISNSITTSTTRNALFQNHDEIRIIILGDSPVEGIGNKSHNEALGGQTAYSIMRTFRKPVRYWSLGKSGLTANGIQQEMVPIMKKIMKKYKNSNSSSNRRDQRSSGTGIDLVVISAGVNNVLWGHSYSTFQQELNGLLHSIYHDDDDFDCSSSSSSRLSRNVPVIFLGLLDFEHMPFLPFPLSKFAGWRSRMLQQAMVDVVNEWSKKERRIVDIAYIPEVKDILESKKDDHPLLEGVVRKEESLSSSLKVDDFFAEDGFHPAGYGTIMLGNLITQTWKENMIYDDNNDPE